MTCDLVSNGTQIPVSWVRVLCVQTLVSTPLGTFSLPKLHCTTTITCSTGLKVMVMASHCRHIRTFCVKPCHQKVYLLCLDVPPRAMTNGRFPFYYFFSRLLGLLYLPIYLIITTSLSCIKHQHRYFTHTLQFPSYSIRYNSDKNENI